MKIMFYMSLIMLSIVFLIVAIPLYGNIVNDKICILSSDKMITLVGGCAGCEGYCEPCHTCKCNRCCYEYWPYLQPYCINLVLDVNDCWNMGKPVWSCSVNVYYGIGCTGELQRVDHCFGDECD